MAGPAFFDQTLDVNFKGNIVVDGTQTVTGAQTFTGAATFAATITVGTGATITAGGLTITAGGLTITAGGLTHVAGNVGFFNATPVAQQSQPTAAHATLTQAGTDNGDVAIQAATSSTPFGYANADEFEAHLAVSLNNAVRIGEVITALQNLGLMASS